ncbi:MAG TPA: LOG family protein [Dehalococcoidia bacterium]|nr:LOG family protein [Dehalococcoidia bacterium]
MPARPLVTVFGSSQIVADHPEYAFAIEIGRRLAEAGYNVCTGGYDGAMAAVSRGAKEAGGATIGVTLEAFRRISANPWVDEEIKTDTLLLRLEHLITNSVGFIVLPGGIGTLLELALVWNLALTGVTNHKPIVVASDGWRKGLSYLREVTHVRDLDLDWLIFTRDPAETIESLQRAIAAGPREYGGGPRG